MEKCKNCGKDVNLEEGGIEDGYCGYCVYLAEMSKEIPKINE